LLSSELTAQGGNRFGAHHGQPDTGEITGGRRRQRFAVAGDAQKQAYDSLVLLAERTYKGKNRRNGNCCIAALHFREHWSHLTEESVSARKALKISVLQ
jgi:hypothetical protein